MLLPKVSGCTMLLRCILAFVFSLGLVLPAQAVLTFGVAADNASWLRSESEARQQATQLQQLLNEEVRLRVFRSEAELNEWMQRYRVVDLALVSKAFYSRQPAGSLILLRQASATDLAVARPGLKAETLDRLRSAVTTLTFDAPAPQPVAQKALQRPRKPAATLARPGDEELQPGHEILAAPGQAPRVTAQPPRPAKTAKSRGKKSSAQTKSISSKPVAQPQAPAVAAQKPAAVVEKPAPAAAAPTTPVTVSPAPPAIPSAPALVLPPPQPAPSEPSPATTPTAGQESPPPSPASPLEPPAPVTAAEPDPPSAVPWLGIVILLSGFGYLYYRRRQQKRPIDWSAVNQKKPAKIAAPAPPKRAPAAPRPGTEQEPAPSRPIPMTRVPLPPARKPIKEEVAAAPQPAPAVAARSIETAAAILLAPESSSSLDSMAALLTNDAPETVNPPPSVDLPSLPIEDPTELDLDIPALELDLPLPESAEDMAVPATPLEAEPEPEPEPTAAPSLARTKKSFKSAAELPPLRGDIATVNIPRLLEAAAAQPGPCILHIRGRHDEKRLHFRDGHLADAVSVNRANRAKTGFLMNKVGYLLIRQGRITEEQRDQALRLCEERPKLRIGEALVELGALSRESLLEALRTQVEGVIFSLFIFPDGRYEIVADDSDAPAANDLNIDLEGLLSKAEAQEPEWVRIRQAIPTLDTVLDFPEGGRDKLDSARMTEHQKLVLSLINGHRPIRDICIAATMLDLEVYKFLFFMVNAKILIRA